MITLEILEEAVGIEHLSDNEYSELDTNTQELFFLFPMKRNNRTPTRLLTYKNA